MIFFSVLILNYLKRILQVLQGTFTQKTYYSCHLYNTKAYRETQHEMQRVF